MVPFGGKFWLNLLEVPKEGRSGEGTKDGISCVEVRLVESYEEVCDS